MADDLAEKDIFNTLAKRQEVLKKQDSLRNPTSPVTQTERPINVGGKQLTMEGAFGLIGNNTKALLDRDYQLESVLSPSQLATTLTEVDESGKVIEKKVGEVIDEIRQARSQLTALGLSADDIKKKEEEVLQTLGVPVEQSSSRSEKSQTRGVLKIFTSK